MNADKRQSSCRHQHADLRSSAFIGVLVILCLSIAGFAQEPAAADNASVEKPKTVSRYALSIVEEGALYAGLRAPLPRAGNLLLLQPSFQYRRGERWRFSTSLAAVTNSYQETHAKLRVKETYFSVTAGDWDFAAGKRIVRWGTGYAFTPTGVLDPPRLATDPNDRLNLNEGREMATANWVHGRHSVTAAWASGGLLQTHRVGMRETSAARYNTMMAGFDAAVIYAHDRGGANFAGANFTRVFGEAIELHGEFARRTGSEFISVPVLPRPLLLPHNDRTAVLIGGKYTHRTGIGAIIEFYSSDSLLKVMPVPASGVPAVLTGSPSGFTERRHYAFARLGKSRLRELPGWKEWDVSFSVVAEVSDGTRVWIFDTERRIRNRFSLYTHSLLPSGKAWESEYGMIPYHALVSAGFRFQI